MDFPTKNAKIPLSLMLYLRLTIKCSLGIGAGGIFYGIAEEYYTNRRDGQVL